ncbi:leucine-rich repeat-containing G-protein coupled receptor 5-like [Lineus longissimus]|uniref:leucine-rich repeat-containing G-protein coupled receptor 5-like n=1 Tax=Lineus longissimus TaxID=88925 RepID=UPI002B4F0C85
MSIVSIVTGLSFYCLLVILVHTSADFQCPCRCETKTGMTTVDCTNSDLYNKVPNLGPRDGSASLTRFKFVLFKNNQLTSIPAYAFRGLRIDSLRFTQNNLTSIHPDAFREMIKLSSLSLDSCGLTEVPDVFRNSPEIASLNFEDNKITNIPIGAFRYAKALQSLNLNKNPLTFTAGMFKGLEASLKKLDIAETNVEKVPTNALASLRNLRQLCLSGNRLLSVNTIFGSDSHDVTSRVGLKVEYDFSSNMIQDISVGAFRERPAPALLKLNNNNLKSLNFIGDPCFFNGTFLMLHGNDIKCSCQDYEINKYPDLTVMGACDILPAKCIDFHKDQKFDCACRKWHLANRYDIEKGTCPVKLTTTAGMPDGATPKVGFVESGADKPSMRLMNLTVHILILLRLSIFTI